MASNLGKYLPIIGLYEADLVARPILEMETSCIIKEDKSEPVTLRVTLL